MEGVMCQNITRDHVLVNNTARGVGSIVGIACQEGYKLTGASIVRCTNIGLWVPTLPRCDGSGGAIDQNQIMIIIICSVATLIALVVLMVALYMLCCNIKEEKSVQKEEEDYIRRVEEAREYHAVTQDCVGMPPVIYGNINPTLLGRVGADEADDKKRSSVASESDTIDQHFCY